MKTHSKLAYAFNNITEPGAPSGGEGKILITDFSGLTNSFWVNPPPFLLAICFSSLLKINIRPDDGPSELFHPICFACTKE